MDKHKLMKMRGITVGASYFVLMNIFEKFQLFTNFEYKYIQSLIVGSVIIGLLILFDHIVKKKYPNEIKQLKLERTDERARVAQGKASTLTLKVLIVLGILFLIAISLNSDNESLLYLSWAFIAGGLTYYIAYSFYEAQ